MFRSNLIHGVVVALLGCSFIGTREGLAQPACCPVTSPCAGDANQDGSVDPLDGGFILARFGQDVLALDNCQADVNCDGIIDPLDVGFALERFNECDFPTFCAPGGGECADPQPHDCCEGDEIPGCQDEFIRDCVCAFDSVCCDLTWDEACEKEVELFGCASCNPDCDTLPLTDDCECVTPVVIENNEIVQFFGDSTGATIECDALGVEEVWVAWTHEQADTVRIDYCGTEIPFDFLFVVIDNNCPCDEIFILGTQITATCADATTAAGLRFNNLAPGTYYYPVLSGPAGVDGSYGIRIRRNDVN